MEESISIPKTTHLRDPFSKYQSQYLEMSIHSSDTTKILNQETSYPITSQNDWEEKKSTFVKLKLWEEERSKLYLVIQSAKHRLLIENIFYRILNKAIIAREANLAAARFLKDRAMTDLMYANSLRSQLVYLPSNYLQSSVGSLKHGLAAISNFQSELANRLKEFSNQIEK